MKNSCNKPAALIEKENNIMLEHYTLYPLPDNRKGPSSTYCRKSITLDSGEVLVFEFDFVPHTFWDDLENHIPHNCATCEWVDFRGRGTSYCKTPTETPEAHCEDWELSPDVIRFAQSEYYKYLHNKHYGTTSVSV